MNNFAPITPFRFWCQKVLPLVYDDSLSYYETLCKVTDKLNEIVERANQSGMNLEEFQEYVAATYETIADLKFNRKLDENGDFTGTIYGKPGYWLLSNKDQIEYLISQFQNGQTGWVIDGGFFTETGVRNSYNGGYF